MLSELFPRNVLIPPSAVNGSAEFPRRLSIFLPQATVRELPTRSLRGSSLSRWVCRTAPARPDISVCTHRVSQAGVACPRGPLSVHFDSMVAGYASSSASAHDLLPLSLLRMRHLSVPGVYHIQARSRPPLHGAQKSRSERWIFQFLQRTEKAICIVNPEWSTPPQIAAL